MLHYSLNISNESFPRLHNCLSHVSNTYFLDKEHPCGESQEVYDAWTNARSQAWIEEKPALEVHKAAWDAAKEALADEEDHAEKLTCIGIYAGISSGIHECDVIDRTAELAAELEDVDEEEAQTWGEETVAEIYSEWWTSYEEICGPRQGKFLIQICISKVLCISTSCLTNFL